MSSTTTILLGLGGGILIVFLITLFIYNSLIRSRNQVKNAYAGIDTQLVKRYDLIPKLVKTVEAYAEHEKDTLERVTSLRNQAMAKDLSSGEKVALDNQISKGLINVLAVAENYPDLKANENFLQLQRSLNEIEAQISASRRTYNASVTNYNNSIQVFPNVMFAGMFGFKSEEVFVAPDQARQSLNHTNWFKN